MSRGFRLAPPLVLLLIHASLAIGAEEPRVTAFLERAHAAHAKGHTGSIAALAASDRYAAHEAINALLREGAAGDLAIARELSEGYAKAFSDESQRRRVAVVAGWSSEQRVRWKAALQEKTAARQALFEGHLEDAQAGFERALPMFSELGDGTEESKALGGVAAVFATSGDSRRALEQLDAAQEAAQRAGDPALLGPILINRSYALDDLGRLEEALTALDEALANVRMMGDTSLELRAAINRGASLRTLGRNAEADAAYRAAAETAHRAHDVEAESNAWFNIGLGAGSADDMAVAQEAFTRALALAQGPALRPLAISAHLALSRIARERGRWSEDRKHLDLARTLLAGIDNPQQVAEVEVSEADHRIARGRFEEALPFLTAAQNRLEGLDAVERLGEVLATRAAAEYYTGRYVEAEESMRRALALAQASRNNRGEAARRAVLGFLLFTLGERAEALTEIEQAARIHETAGAVADRVDDLDLLGVVRFRSGDLAGARAALEQALALSDTGNPSRRGELIKDLAEVELAEGGERRASGRRRLAEARAIAAGTGNLLSLIHVNLLEAEAALDDADTIHAREALERATSAGARTSTREFAWQAEYVRGRVLEAERQPASAIRSYRTAIDEVERSRAATGRPAGRAAILEDRVAPYRALARLLRGRGEIEESWQVARAGKARTFVEALLPAPLEAVAGVPEEPQPRAQDAGATREGLLGAAKLRSLLRPRELLLDWYVDGDELWVYVVRSDRVTVRSVPFGRASVDLASVTRWPGRPVPEDAPITAAWRSAVRELGATLLAPLESELSDADALLIVPSGPLHGVPFAALELSGRRLVERHAIGVLPAAEVLRSRARAPRGTGLIAFGDPATDADVPPIPAAGDEARSIAAASANGRAVVGIDATEALFASLAPKAARIHIAAHGRADRGSASRAHLLLAPGGGEDGRLEAVEVARLSLGASVVVLSGCGTGVEAGIAREVSPADERTGLPRAFLAAGAGEVVAGLWEVEDEAQRTLMVRFYELLREHATATAANGASAAGAAARLQREAVSGKASAELHALDHPYYWAGLVVYGAGLRSGPDGPPSR